ncbi:MAG: PD40 domain-containing protein, partial [Planctomycetes bacterium]|nr:PD40 domain-containing protein [Planctomycetota bacterium]
EYSPDGKRLLCIFNKVEGDSRHYDVAICNGDGKVQTVLDRIPAKRDRGPGSYMFVPRWSPDGRFVSYLSEDSSNNDIVNLHVREAEGPYHFVINKVSTGYAWSSNSREIAVISTDSEDLDTASLGSLQIWDVVVGEMTGEPAGVLFHPWTSLAWTKGGNGLLFAACRLEMPLAGHLDSEELSLQIFSVNRDGTDLKALLKEPGLSKGMAGMFDLSPDGKRIVYVVLHPAEKPEKPNNGLNFDVGLAGDVCVANADGSQPRKVLEGVKVYTFPRWLDNNRFVCATETEGEEDNQGHIYLVEPDGKTVDLLPLVQPILEAAEKKPQTEKGSNQK